MKLPDEYLAFTRVLMGESLWADYLRALGEPPSVSIRLNRLKTSEGLRLTDISDGQVSWCKEGHYLNHRPNFTFDPLFHAGVYYVQEAASMFLHHVLSHYVSQPVLMLDLCAAPGGKSTVARAALPKGSLLVSNEPMRQRCQVLAENMQKWGHPDVVVTNNYPHDFRRCGVLFDVILADVPCSGEGMMRKEAEAVAQWTPSLVSQCATLQREIVTDAWAVLKPGGYLFYSTCTMNTAENEENICYFERELGAEVLPVDVEDAWNITGSLLKGWERPVCRFIPGRTRGEGLFMAVLRKGDCEMSVPKPKKQKSAPQKKSKPIEIPLVGSDDFVVVERQDRCMAVNQLWKGVLQTIDSSLNVLSAGVPLYEMKGRDLVPSHALALSALLKTDAFPRVELDFQQAISYLRREAFVLPGGTPRGYVVVCFQHTPLGFMKNLGNRANNLYPQEWRIRSTHLPDDACPIFEQRKN